MSLPNLPIKPGRTVLFYIYLSTVKGDIMKMLISMLLIVVCLLATGLSKDYTTTAGPYSISFKLNRPATTRCKNMGRIWYISSYL